MTYEDLMRLALEGDPLIDPDRPDSATITPEGLLILGSWKSSYQSDLLVRIEPDGQLRSWIRDPAERPDDEVPFHGIEWTSEFLAPDYEALVGWAYSW